MSLTDALRYFRRVYRATHQELPHQDEYERLAEDALKACSEWFGPPCDPRREFSLYVSADDMSGCGYFAGSYAIYLASGLDTPEERCETIGHEMCHRVTMRRPGLRRERWIDEITAFFAAQWFLERHGHGDRARANRRRFLVRDAPVDIDALRRFRVPRSVIVTKNKSEYYPPDFYPDVWRLGTALCWVVPASELARLPWAKSLPDWISSLPDDCRAQVERLFDPSRRDGPTSDAPLANIKLGEALKSLGRFDEAFAHFQSAQSRDGGRPDLSFHIGLCAERAGCYDEAIDAYGHALRHNLEDEWIPYNLALIHRKRGDHRAAIECFEEALRRKPDWYLALCYGGKSYDDDGRPEKAIECWQRIVETGPRSWPTWAKDALIKHRADPTPENRDNLTA